MTQLVLLPGMDGTGELFEPLLEALNGRLHSRVVRYPTTAYSYRDLAALAQQAVPDNEPYVLLGESFSGPIAITLAASRPRALRGVILAASFSRCPSAWLARVRHLLPLIPTFPPPTALLRGLLCNGIPRSIGIEAKLQNAVLRVPPAVLMARLRQVAAVDVSPLLSEVDVPLLYLRARHDRVVSQEALAHIQHFKPQMQVAEFDSPHLLLQTAATAAAETVRRFIESTGAPDASGAVPVTGAVPFEATAPTLPCIR